MLGPSFAGPQIANWPRKRVFAGFTGAYDDIPNIVALYSFRRCLSSYTGNLLRLRRSSDNAEQDFGYVSNGDLDTDAISTFLGGATGTIVTLYDQAPTDDATQATAAAQPEQIPNGQNGHTVGRFDGSDDVLTASAIAWGSEFSIMALAKSPSTPSSTEYIFDNGSDDGVAFPRITSSDGITVSVNGVGAVTTDGVVTRDFTVYTVVRSASWNIYQNGAALNIINGELFEHNPPTGSLGIGARADNSAVPFTGDFAEIVVADAAWSTADREAVESAGADYWAITLS